MDFKDNVTGFQHIGIPSSDLEKSTAFYKSIGFEPVFECHLESGEDVCYLQQKSCIVETWQGGDVKGKIGAIDHFTVDVKDIKAAWDKIVELGYEIVEPEINSLPFWKNGVRCFTVVGPDQVLVEFNQIL